ncbi:MAG TPA: hypothetical protein VMV10_09500 [Pirellulales bacterium]|nr:hypothetical protein [Pirellulales bacterium]
MQTNLPHHAAGAPHAELDPRELHSPVQALADAALLVLVLLALAIVLIGMLLGPIVGLVTPEL